MACSLDEQVDASVLQDVLKSGTLPGAIHDSAIAPVNAGNFGDESPHRVASKTRALERTSHFVLLVTGLEVFDGKGKLLVDGSIDTHFVLAFFENAYRSVIAIIADLLGDEAVLC